MQLEDVLDLLSNINGCTFASLDAETEPTKGIRLVEIGLSIILFTNKKSSGYENMVRRRLAQAGKNPDNFMLSDLPWGERVENTPLITHKGNYYLQTIILGPGQGTYYLGDKVINPTDFGIRPRRTNQGLVKGNEVLVCTYKLENITRLKLLGEDVKGVERPILSVKF